MLQAMKAAQITMYLSEMADKIREQQEKYADEWRAKRNEYNTLAN